VDNLRPFELERYFALHEFKPGISLMCCSDAEPNTLQDLLALSSADMLERYHAMSLAYTESRGDPMLLEMIASEYYDTVSSENLVLVVPEEGVLLTMMAASFEPDDYVVCMSPNYQSLAEIARSKGATIVDWNPRFGIRDGGSLSIEFDVEDLRRIVSEECARPPKAIVVNYPHNPTGALVTKQEFRDIVEIARENDAILFSDEMYNTLEYEASLTLPSAVDMDYEKSVVLHGLSKTVGCPGLRVGWIATKDRRLLDEICKLKDYTTICAPRPSEILAMIAVENRSELTARTMGIVCSNLTLLDSFFEKYRSIFAWQRPTAGTIAFPRLLEAAGATSADAFCDSVREDANVLLLPSSVYTSSNISKEPFFRLGFGRRNMPDALAGLDAYLEKKYLT